MKVRIQFTLDIDPDAWRERIVEPDATLAEIREDVRSFVEHEISLGLSDEGVLLR